MLRRVGHAMFRRTLSSRVADPYAVLGVARTASSTEIRTKYLKLAKELHPDVAPSADAPTPVAAGGQSFSLISAAYNMLSDPQRRAETDAAMQRPEDLAKEMADHSIALGHAGQIAPALALLASALEPRVPYPFLVDAASRVLELCAQSGQPHHTLGERVYGTLRELGAVDSRANNAYFQLALRGGHMGLAMRAAKHAAASGLEQSLLMQSTVRQVKRYRASVRAKEEEEKDGRRTPSG